MERLSQHHGRGGSGAHPRASADPIALQHRLIRRALLATTLVIAGGTTGFILLEGWGLWRSLYFTISTITTVGYGDDGISARGQVFATLVLLGGIAVASYTFGLVVQYAISKQLAWRERMQTEIDRTQQHAILCGYGRMGRVVCNELAAMGISFVVVEADARRFEEACGHGHLAVEGDAGSDETLERAGIARAKVLVATASRGADNLAISLSARHLNPELMIIARAEGAEETKKLLRAGATRAVSPYQSGGAEIANAIGRPMVADFLARSTMHGGDVGLAELEIRPGSPLEGRSIAEVGQSDGDRLSFVALEHRGEDVRIPPAGRDRFETGDRLILAGDPEQIRHMQDLAASGASSGSAAA